VNGFIADNLFALMPVFPLLGWVLNTVFGKRMKEPVPGMLASSMVFVSFVIAMIGFFQVRGLEEGQRILDTVRWDFLPGVGGNGQNLHFGFALDQLSSLMTLIITGVGLLIHVFAIGYMHGDAGFSRFFAYLNFFVGMMLILVLGDSLPLLFVGWEGVGVASYLLIGFWYKERTNNNAARKAFIVNRVGDAFFMLGMFLLFKQFGTLNIVGIGVAREAQNLGFGNGTIELACLFLFLGAAGKSAQLPLSTWLPDAMAGPTPVSALIHAATMVTAGVYLIARLFFLYDLAPIASAVVAWAGVLTALYGALSAMAQTDIKKILAYSTISQLGYMFLAVGAGAYWAGIFHVMTHAFFKALLFLASGSVIHALSGEQDVRKMGGLRGKLPTTHLVALIGVLSIAGIPIFSGFFSKDVILEKAFTTPYGGFEGAQYALWFIGFGVAVLTAYYMWRWYALVFLGDYRGREHPHESPRVMTVPLVILAGLSVVGGLVGLPHALEKLTGAKLNLIEPFLEKAAPSTQLFAEIPLWGEWLLILVAILAAIGGIWMASSTFQEDGPKLMGDVPGPFGDASRNALYLDRAYDTVLSMPARATSTGLEVVDTQGLDNIVKGSAGAVAEAGASLRLWESGFVRSYGLAVLIGTAILVAFLVIRSFS
jgi:NADH-quinone oxidoreductase subunit L